MPRYYFYQADLYTREGSIDGEDRRLGCNHGIYVVEDESSPDVIFEQIVKGLEDDANAQYEANAKAANVQPEPNTMYYVMKQFAKVVE
jgi:hypothetical protein